MMPQNFSLKPLADNSLLPQIYEFRVKCWIESKYGHLVSEKAFSSGMHDSLDHSAKHWVMHNEENRLIGSGRVNILPTLDDFPSDLETNEFKRLIGDWHTNVAFISRLVIEQKYRYMGLSKDFDYARLRYLKESEARIVVAYAHPERLKTLYSYGFVDVGQFSMSLSKSFAPTTFTAIMADIKQLRV